MPPPDAEPLTPLSRWTLGRLLGTLAACVAAWAVVAAVALCVGPPTARFGWPTVDQMPFRSDRVVMASLIGAALAAAGVTYQAVLRNPLADPYLLGVSSGASLAAFAWQFAPVAVLATVIGQQAFAFLGALCSVAVVLGLSGRRGRLQPVTLLLVGVIVNAVCGSVFLLLNAISRDRAGPAGGALRFLVGGIPNDLTRGQEVTATVVVAIGWLVLLSLGGQLNAAPLDEAEAAALGVRVHRLRWTAVVTASLMTAAVVAVSGPIGFVGLICPHIARRCVGPDPRRSLPLATAAGASLLVAADAVSRALLSPQLVGTLLPVGVLTGLMGGPFFLALLWQSRRTLD